MATIVEAIVSDGRPRMLVRVDLTEEEHQAFLDHSDAVRVQVVITWVEAIEKYSAQSRGNEESGEQL